VLPEDAWWCLCARHLIIPDAEHVSLLYSLVFEEFCFFLHILCEHLGLDMECISITPRTLRLPFSQTTLQRASGMPV